MQANVPLLADYLLSSSIALWILADARQHRHLLPYDFDSFVFWAWPGLVPLYLLRTRGWRGFIPIGWFILLFLAASAIAGISAQLLAARA